MTIKDLRGELNVYNNILNHFIYSFDLELLDENYGFIKKIPDLRDYTEVSDELYKLLIAHKEEISQFSTDYYEWKTAKTIAQKININVEDILSFLNKIAWRGQTIYPTEKTISRRFPDMHKFNGIEITEETEIKKISSYWLLKHFQLIERKQCIIKTFPNRR